jgi:glycosyltransferase involved in cell wall biosynthesis
MPHVQFLAVQGGWKKKTQIRPFTIPANARWMDFQTDVRKCYRETKVLVYPLGQHAPEGWIDGAPMSPLEAACSGIPTIATPQPGMVEVMGEHACYVAGYQRSTWADAIESVLADWDAWSARAYARAERLDPAAELDRVEAFLKEIA